MTPEEELALLRMENDFLRQNRDQWKDLAAAYEFLAKQYRAIVETFAKAQHER